MKARSTSYLNCEKEKSQSLYAICLVPFYASDLSSSMSVRGSVWSILTHGMPALPIPIPGAKTFFNSSSFSSETGLESNWGMVC